MFTKNPNSLEGNLVGYINPNNYFPSAMVAVYSNEDNFFVRYPNLKAVELSEVHFEEAKKDSEFIPLKDTKKIQKDEYVFGLSPERIIVATHETIIGQLEREIQSNTLSKKDSRIISEYIKNS